MKRTLLLSLVSVIVAALVTFGDAYAQLIEIPTLRSRVIDLTGALQSRAAQLEQKLAELEIEKGSQVAVLVVPTSKPEPIEQFSMRVVERWKLGRRGIDDGVLLLVALSDRKVRIEVGRGLEGDIPDAIASRIIREHILPPFKQGDVPTGVEAGVDALAGLIRGVPLPSPQRKKGSGNEGIPSVLVFLFICVLFSIVLVLVASAKTSESMIFQGSNQRRRKGGGRSTGDESTSSLDWGSTSGGSSSTDSSSDSSSSSSSSSSFDGGGGSFSGGGASGDW